MSTLSAAAAVVPITGPAGRAARRVCQAAAPDLLLASHFLPRPQRQSLWIVLAVLQQIRQIMATEAADAEQSGGAGGCTSCAEEGCGPAVTVARAVLDHLFAGKSTGRPELDAFAAVAAARSLDRGLFDDLLTGLAERRALPRCPTWKRFLALSAGSAGRAARIVAQTSLLPPGEALSAVQGRQLEAWAAAVDLIALLGRPAAMLAGGQVLIPLDDLVHHRLSERELRSMAKEAQGQAGRDPRWAALLDFEEPRIDKLLRGGEALAGTLPPASGRALRVMSGLARVRWQALRAQPWIAFSQAPRPSLWPRLRAVVAAMTPTPR